MAKKKVTKKVSTPKKIARIRSKSIRPARSRAVSFFIGVITVLLIGFLIFRYAQANNYKTILGEQTENVKQITK